MIIVTGEFDLAHAGAMDHVMAIARPIQRATRDDEHGCHAYVFSPDSCLPGRAQLYELWEDEASLAAHFQHENYLSLGRSLGDVEMKGGVSTKFRVTAAEPIYDESHKARAEFFTSARQAPAEMIIIAGEIDLDDPSLIDDGVKRSMPLQQATRDNEAGCEAYVFSKDPCVDGRIAIFERWSNQAALAAHFQHENYLNMRGLLQALRVSSTATKYRCDHHEPLYDDTGTPRAEFSTLI